MNHNDNEAAPNWHGSAIIRDGALLIRPLPPIVEDPPEELPAGGRIIALLDCEATGLDPHIAKIIELAIQLVAIDAAGNIIGHTGPASWREDPGEPLSEDVKRVTRLCDEALTGQKIDEQLAMGMLRRADLIIAHNAAYDATLIERRLPQIAGKPWACSVREIPWLYLGLDGRQQGYLLVQHSWHNFAAHRAAHDVWGLFHLLQCRGSVDGDRPRTHLQRLLETSAKPTVRMSVPRSFEVKDQLKARGFRFDASDKSWWIEVAEHQVETMKAELARLGAAPPIERIITATERHRPLKPDYTRLAENRRRFDEIDTSDPW
jgi:DNA polymerase III subunit epsilon